MGGKAVTFSFRPHERLTRSRDFSQARRSGRRWVGRWLVLWSFRRTESPLRAARLGLVVGRRHGGAVERNRFKRRVRDVYRHNKWPRGHDVVVTPKTGGPLFPPSHEELRTDYGNLKKRAVGPSL